MPSAAGTTVSALKSALRELVGDRILADALAAVPPDTADKFEPVTPMTWVPVAVVNEVVAKVAEYAQRPFDELMDEAVQRAGEKTLRTAWRMLLRVTSDRALLSRAPVLYARWRNVGKLAITVLSPGKVEIVLSEWPGVDERSIRSLGVTIMTVMRLAGRRQLKVDTQPVADGARYAVTWEV